MGWFWGDSKNDPVQKLDPGLRDYLEQEKPDKYVPGPNVKPPPSTPAQTPEPSDPSKPQVPAASLYQDGRYADLWKTYKPPAVDDGEQVGIRGASRVIEKHKEHGDTVQRAAMENCALEHEALTYCFQTGNWRKQIEARLTLCSAENSTFSRCFMTQTVSRHLSKSSQIFPQLTQLDRNSCRPSGTQLDSIMTLKKKSAFSCMPTSSTTRCSTTKSELKKQRLPAWSHRLSRRCSTLRSTRLHKKPKGSRFREERQFLRASSRRSPCLSLRPTNVSWKSEHTMRN